MRLLTAGYEEITTAAAVFEHSSRIMQESFYGSLEYYLCHVPHAQLYTEEQIIRANKIRIKTYRCTAFIFKKLHNIFYNVNFFFRLSVLTLHGNRSCITLGFCVIFFGICLSLSCFSNLSVPLDISNLNNETRNGSVKDVHSLQCKLLGALRAFNLLRQQLQLNPLIMYLMSELVV